MLDGNTFFILEIFLKYWLAKQTDLPEKSKGFLGIFSLPSWGRDTGET